MAWKWPWPRAGNAGARIEEKQAVAGGFIALHAQGEAHWTRRDYATLAREGFMRNPIVHRAVRLISETASAIPWLLYEDANELENHPLLGLLERPNQRQAGATFFEALYGHLLLSGNAYVEIIDGGGEARELHLLRPDRVAVVTDAGGWPVALDYREGSGRRRVDLGPEGPGGAAHLTLFHPLDDHYGFPPLEAALMALDTHNASGRWNKALLDNSARPSGALVYAPKDGGNLTQEQFDRLKVELEQGYSGATRAGRPLLLEGGLDWKAMALTPKDMDFIEAKHSASRDIALAFGVPPMLLGIPGDNTYANYQEANRAFYRLTVLPLVARTAKELSAWLGSVFGGDLRLAELQFPTMELYAMPAATASLLEDTVVDLDQWISSEVEAAFAEQEGAAFVSGDGTSKPKGFLEYTTIAEASWAWGKIGYTLTGVAGELPEADPSDVLIDTVYALKAGYRQNANWVMNRKTQATIRKLKDADGNYLWQPPAAPGQRAMLMGFPLVEAEDMPDIAADATPVAFGDFGRGYLVVDRAGVRVLRDPYSAKPYVLFYTTKRVGGGVQDFDAIKLLKFGTA